jgi:transposase
MGISRQCASKWVNRYRKYGEAGLLDRPSVPHHQPTATSSEVVARIEWLRRDRKHSARRIALELVDLLTASADGLRGGCNARWVRMTM